MKKNMLAAGVVVGSVLVLSACQFDGFGLAEQAVSSYDVPEKVLRLTVDAGSGDIVVNESDRTGIKVTETIHWNKEKPETEHVVTGDTLALKYTCPGGFGAVTCSVDYKIEIPKGVTVKADTGSGDIVLRSLSGEVDADTGAGDIDATGLGGKRFLADSGAGDIEAKFAAAPDDVQIETGAGDATVRLPRETYRVTAETGAGDETIEVANDASASRTVRVETGAGDAKVLPS
ncbi:DUF4097 family beta strand repeat-containing protein [Planomonospora venezuelensis]|uniref:DUF4097 and DUF4098 domain-containing protein YvlB n=1 Tax=Planomonospora venezuelensis TaxID=1999 RepID=A0A841D7R5_PLAVE|nr:DUF4097 family beta strand repeat-containing protein [Planomonospora venezuelensis]MBB5964534.1 DUF4097 and DUF4098 domain-containing protein YvlB [Planomonospora venezuelensis]GIN02831.1 hypothetical protein Pve01_44890 [Planomonospora venezuelensis]